MKIPSNLSVKIENYSNDNLRSNDQWQWFFYLYSKSIDSVFVSILKMKLKFKEHIRANFVFLLLIIMGGYYLPLSNENCI